MKNKVELETTLINPLITLDELYQHIKSLHEKYPKDTFVNISEFSTENDWSHDFQIQFELYKEVEYDKSQQLKELYNKLNEINPFINNLTNHCNHAKQQRLLLKEQISKLEQEINE